MKVQIHLSTDEEDTYEDLEMDIMDISDFVEILKSNIITDEDGSEYKFECLYFDAHAKMFDILCAEAD